MELLLVVTMYQVVSTGQVFADANDAFMRGATRREIHEFDDGCDDKFDAVGKPFQLEFMGASELKMYTDCG